MGEFSKIEWTHHTWNPWIGCTKVSPGCKHCYAEAWAGRYGRAWGPGQRIRTSAENWREPVRWQARALRDGTRPRVFCASLADVLDDDPAIAAEWRADLWALIEATPGLDWLLLTKRVGNAAALLPSAWLAGDWPAHVWMGVTVTDQQEAIRDIPRLVALPAPVRFLSCEPLLGPLDLRYACFNGADSLSALAGIDWVIVGGESGSHASPMHADWVRGIRDDCQAAAVPFFFKQWGAWIPDNQLRDAHAGPRLSKAPFGALSVSGDWRPGYFTSRSDEAVFRLGKRVTGRMLDGREWSEGVR